MPESLESLTGWARHSGFGLRTEWLRLHLADPGSWQQTGCLGTRQVQSLFRWLRTGGLVEADGSETSLCAALRRSGVESEACWQALWAEVCFRFPTATWYVQHLRLGEWTTRELEVSLGLAVPRLAARTVTNAILELVGLLQWTPVGEIVRQGRVIGTVHRVVRREGLASPESSALHHAARLLFLHEGRPELRISDPHLWPWTIYGCEPYDVLAQMVAGHESWLALDGDWLRITVGLEALQHVDLL